MPARRRGNVQLSDPGITKKKSGSALRQTGKEIDGRLVALSVLRHRYKLSFFFVLFFFPFEIRPGTMILRVQLKKCGVCPKVHTDYRFF